MLISFGLVLGIIFIIIDRVAVKGKKSALRSIVLFLAGFGLWYGFLLLNVIFSFSSAS